MTKKTTNDTPNDPAETNKKLRIKSDDQDSPDSQEARPQQSAPPVVQAGNMYEVTYLWDKIRSESLNLPASYISDDSSISWTSMAHVLSLSGDAWRVDGWDKKFISAFYKAMNERGALSTSKLPGIYSTARMSTFTVQTAPR